MKNSRALLLGLASFFYATLAFGGPFDGLKPPTVKIPPPDTTEAQQKANATAKEAEQKSNAAAAEAKRKSEEEAAAAKKKSDAEAAEAQKKGSAAAADAGEKSKASSAEAQSKAMKFKKNGKSVEVSPGAGGPLYTVKNAKGKVLDDHLTADELKKKDPKTYQWVTREAARRQHASAK